MSSSSSDYSQLVPFMTAANAPSPFVVSTDSEPYISQPGWKALDGSNATYWTGNFSYGCWLKIDCGAGNEKTVNAYTMYDAWLTYAKGWILQGSNDDSNWDDLDTQTNQNINSSTQYYYFSNSTAYRYYRFFFTDRYGNGGYITVSEIGLFDFDNNSSSSVSSSSSISSPSSSSSVSSLSSSSSSSVSSVSSQSSLYGYLSIPANFRKTSFDASSREFTIEWDWTNPPLANPQEPTGFTIERRIGSRDWSVLSFSIPGDARSYIDTLTSDEMRNVLINGEQVGYRIKAYWEDPS